MASAFQDLVMKFGRSDGKGELYNDDITASFQHLATYLIDCLIVVGLWEYGRIYDAGHFCMICNGKFK